MIDLENPSQVELCIFEGYKANAEVYQYSYQTHTRPVEGKIIEVRGKYGIMANEFYSGDSIKSIELLIDKDNEPVYGDLTYGTDKRGDDAYFIEIGHFSGDGWGVDDKARLGHKEPTFFRVINNGKHQKSHGWLEDNKVVQWG